MTELGLDVVLPDGRSERYPIQPEVVSSLEVNTDFPCAQSATHYCVFSIQKSMFKMSARCHALVI